MDFKRNDNLIAQENSLLKLKIQELEDNIAHLNKVIEDYKAKEESISSAIVFAVERSNQLEASRKKLYQLDIQRSRLLYMRMEQVINELYLRYPELKKDAKLADMSEKFKQAVFSQVDLGVNDVATNQTSVKEDPIRKLLNNIINYIGDEKEVKTIQRADKIKIPEPRYDKTNTSINKSSDTQSFSKKPTSTSAFATTPSSSGFDINEALHPSESLEEILKAFDLGKGEKD